MRRPIPLWLRDAPTVTIGGDLTVRRMGFGAMRLTGPGILGAPADPEKARAVLRRAVELGVNFIDTADSYGPELNERQIAEALHPYPDGLVIATKGGTVRGPRGEWNPRGNPEHLRKACEGSLKRLRLERIDLYQLHTVDPLIPIEESVGALAQLQAEGSIRHIGLSNVTTRQFLQASAVARVATVQNRYSLADRGSEDVLAECERRALMFIPWFPLGAGSLTERSPLLREIASRLGATPAQVALAWLIQRSPQMLPIPGTSSLEHLEENVAAAFLGLGAEDFSALDRASRGSV